MAHIQSALSWLCRILILQHACHASAKLSRKFFLCQAIVCSPLSRLSLWYSQGREHHAWNTYVQFPKTKSKNVGMLGSRRDVKQYWCEAPHASSEWLWRLEMRAQGVSRDSKFCASNNQCPDIRCLDLIWLQHSLFCISKSFHTFQCLSYQVSFVNCTLGSITRRRKGDANEKCTSSFLGTSQHWELWGFSFLTCERQENETNVGSPVSRKISCQEKVSQYSVINAGLQPCVFSYISANRCTMTP